MQRPGERGYKAEPFAHSTTGGTVRGAQALGKVMPNAGYSVSVVGTKPPTGEGRVYTTLWKGILVRPVFVRYKQEVFQAWPRLRISGRR